MKNFRAAQRAWDAMEPPDDAGPDCPECGDETSNYGMDHDELGPCSWVAPCDGCQAEIDELEDKSND